MACTACGDAPKKDNSFTKAVLEINNPEQLVLFRKVVIPASMGDEEAVPASIGKYRNVLLHYEMNGHNYLYSTDGIPTLLSAEIPQEVLDKLNALEDGLETEVGEREAGDNDLAASIIAEETTRAAADASLEESLVEEAAVRKNADTALNERADSLSSSLDDEVSARESGDTALQNNIDVEAQARVAADTDLQEQIDAITVSSDVTDVVGTKAELDAYDTSKLKDNDIVKVLQDESHDDETTYYRWIASSSSFTLIGEEGPYYTKSQADTLLDAKADKATTYTKTEVDTELADKQDTLTAGEDIEIVDTVISATSRGLAKVLTADDYNWNTTTSDETEPYNAVALWKLDNGIYQVNSGLNFRVAVSQPSGAGTGVYLKANEDILFFNPGISYLTYNYAEQFMKYHVANNGAVVSSSYIPSTTTITTYLKQYITKGNGAPTSGSLDGTAMLYLDNTNKDLYIYSGATGVAGWTKIPKTDTTYSDFAGTDGAADGEAGLVPAPTADDAGKYLKADGTWGNVNAGPTVVQTVGTSTTDVMSQKATTSMIYSDPSTRYDIRIGAQASSASTAYSTIAIGRDATATGSQSLAIGVAAKAEGGASGGDVAVGYGAEAQNVLGVAIGSHPTAAAYSVAIGARSSTGTSTNSGAIAIGASTVTSCTGPLASALWSIAIGSGQGESYAHVNGVPPRVSGERAIGIGNSTIASAKNSIALGAYANATVQGQIDVSTSAYTGTTNDLGYSGSSYRLLTGLYDAQSDHDAVNLGQMNAAIAVAAVPEFTNAEFNSIFGTNLEEES